jgi:hypothetical protein
VTYINRSTLGGEDKALGALGGVCAPEAAIGSDVSAGTGNAGASFEILLRGRNKGTVLKEEVGSTPHRMLRPVVAGLASEPRTSASDHPSLRHRAATNGISEKLVGESHREAPGNEFHLRRKSRLPLVHCDEVADASENPRGVNFSSVGKPVEGVEKVECDAQESLNPSEDAAEREAFLEASTVRNVPHLSPMQAENSQFSGGVGLSSKASTSAPSEVVNGSGEGLGGALPHSPLAVGTTPLGGGDLRCQEFLFRASDGKEIPTDGIKIAFDDLLPATRGLELGAGGAIALNGSNPEFAGRVSNHPLREAIGLPLGDQSAGGVDGGPNPGTEQQSGAHSVGAIQENIASQVSWRPSVAVFKHTQITQQEEVANLDQGDGMSHADHGPHLMISNWSFDSGAAIDLSGSAAPRRVNAAHLVGELAAVRDSFAASSLNRCVVDFEVDGQGSLCVEIVRRSDHLEAVFRTDSESLRDSLRSALSSAEGLRSQLFSGPAQKSESGANGTDLGARENGADSRRQGQPTAKSEGRFLTTGATSKPEPEVAMIGSGVADRLLHTFA